MNEIIGLPHLFARQGLQNKKNKVFGSSETPNEYIYIMGNAIFKVRSGTGIVLTFTLINILKSIDLAPVQHFSY